MVNIGIIGMGRIGKVHLQSITYHVKNACVKAVADPFMNEETKEFVRGMDVGKIYGDYKEIPLFPWRLSRLESMYSARSPWIMRWIRSRRWRMRWQPILNVSFRWALTAVSTIILLP